MTVGWHHPSMRLNPGITLASAAEVLTAAETAWSNAGASGDFYPDYHDAVDATYGPLRECFAEPNLAEAVQPAVYWHLLTLAGPTARRLSSSLRASGSFLRTPSRLKFGMPTTRRSGGRSATCDDTSPTCAKTSRH